MLWLIGGTSESREIAKMLSNHQIEHLVTVTTPEACALYDQINTKIKVDILNPQQIENLIKEQKITAIVDASHPHAQIISQQAIDSGAPYIRYERSKINCSASNTVEIQNIDQLIREKYLENQRVLLAIGYKTLHQFKSLQKKATLFTRILPSIKSLDAALEAGFTNDRILAIRPPISHELERSIWQNWKISTVVAKSNGKTGGEHIKQQLSQELNVKLILLTRPKIEYPRYTDNFSDILSFCIFYE
jgi:precorrin-6A/cobalt-precorrin-6A reductase